MVNMKTCRGRNSQLIVSCRVVTTPCCGLAVICCGFILHLIGRKTINISEMLSGVHGFTGKTVMIYNPKEGEFKRIINYIDKTNKRSH